MNGRKNNNIIILIVAVVSFVIGIGGYVMKADSSGTDRFFIKSSAGGVVFEHQKHTEYAGECINCHHDMLKTDEPNPCSDCHEDFDPADFTHAEMQEVESHTCTTCHQVNEDAQAVSCRNCHSTENEEKKAAVLCIECHEDGYEKGMLTHDELQEMEGHSCDGCHFPRSVTSIYHENCSNCHLLENEDKFTDSTGKVNCKVCHLK